MNYLCAICKWLLLIFFVRYKDKGHNMLNMLCMTYLRHHMRVHKAASQNPHLWLWMVGSLLFWLLGGLSDCLPALVLNFLRTVHLTTVNCWVAKISVSLTSECLWLFGRIHGCCSLKIKLDCCSFPPCWAVLHHLGVVWVYSFLGHFLAKLLWSPSWSCYCLAVIQNFSAPQTSSAISLSCLFVFVWATGHKAD